MELQWTCARDFGFVAEASRQEGEEEEMLGTKERAKRMRVSATCCACVCVCPAALTQMRAFTHKQCALAAATLT